MHTGSIHIPSFIQIHTHTTHSSIYPSSHISIPTPPLFAILKTPPKNAPINVIGTDADPAMPEHCKIPNDSVGSYRKYYILEKRRFAKWDKPNAVMPDWYRKGIDELESNR